MSQQLQEYKATTIIKWHLKIDETGRKEAIVIFECPHCGKEHSVREVYRKANFDQPGRTMDCGAHVSVAMPWAMNK